MSNIFSGKKIFFFTAAIIIIISGCSQAPQQLTDEESLAFAKELENSIKKREGEFLDNAFDKDAFIKRIDLTGMANSKGFGDGVMSKMKLGTQVSNSLSDQDSYEFIKHYTKDKVHHVIFRLYGVEESTLNYHDFELIKVDGKCMIADMYIYLSGETLAETMRNLYKSMVGNNDDNKPSKFSGMDDVADIKKLMQRGKYAEARRIYETLPDNLKNAKPIMLTNILICSNLSNNDYDEAIKKFQLKFPNEPNMNLVMIDGYYLQKEYAKMLSAINALDSQINKDPLLDYYRYLSYNLLEDKANSKLYLTRLVNNKPDFQKGFLELITVELDGKNKTASDSLVKIYRKNPKFKQDELDLLLSYY